jgi:O-antigen/teichoic acid export membrane protein
MALGFASSLFIARWLSPADIGVFSIAAAFMGVAQILRDFGASNYIVQCADPNREVLRSAFGSMLLLSWTLAALLWLTSGRIADFYGQQDLQPLLRVLSINLLLTPLGAVTMALMRRDLQFGAIGIIDLSSAAAQAAVSCLMAWHGWGAMSLAWGSLAGLIVTVLLTLRHRRPQQSWLPGTSRLREVLGFGTYATSASLLGHLNVSSADLVLGRLAGAEAVGLLSRGTSLARLLTNILLRGVTPIIGPLFAQLRRGDGNPETIFVAASARLTVVAWPALAFTAVLAEPIVTLLYGDQWTASARLVPAICIATAIGIPFTMVSQMLTGLGKPQLSMRIEMVNLPLKIASIASAAPFGLHAVAISLIAVSTLGALYQLHTLRQHFGFRPLRLVRVVAPSALVAAITAIVFWAVQHWFGNDLPRLAVIGVAAALGACAWMATVRTISHPVWTDVTNLRAATSKRADGDDKR